jgi:hypothetical protein
LYFLLIVFSLLKKNRNKNKMKANKCKLWMEGRERKHKKKRKEKHHKEKKKHKKEDHREKRRKRKDAEPPHATKEAKVAGRLFAAISRCGSGQKASTTSAAALHDVRYYTARLLRLGTGAPLQICPACFWYLFVLHLFICLFYLLYRPYAGGG